MKTENSRVKALASECANIVTKIELIEHANEEVQSFRKGWCPSSRWKKFEGGLQKVLTKMPIKFKAELADFNAPFEFDGVSTFSVTVQHFMYDPGYN